MLGAQNFTLTVNSVNITAYANKADLETVIAELDKTNFASTGNESDPGMPTHKITCGGLWAKALNNVFSPLANTPSKVTAVLTIGSGAGRRQMPGNQNVRQRLMPSQGEVMKQREGNAACFGVAGRAVFDAHRAVERSCFDVFGRATSDGKVSDLRHGGVIGSAALLQNRAFHFHLCHWIIPYL